MAIKLSLTVEQTKRRKKKRDPLKYLLLFGFLFLLGGMLWGMQSAKLYDNLYTNLAEDYDRLYNSYCFLRERVQHYKNELHYANQINTNDTALHQYYANQRQQLEAQYAEKVNRYRQQVYILINLYEQLSFYGRNFEVTNVEIYPFRIITEHEEQQFLEELVFTTQTYTEIYQQLVSADSGSQTVPFGNPITGRITSYFGYRTLPYGPEFHLGIDIAAPIGSAVRATANGIVTFAGERSSYGKVVFIDHGNGYETRYAHLGSMTVVTGDRIERGKVIGTIGMTGRTTGPHLHYEVRRNGRVVNPALHLDLVYLRR